MADIVYYLLVLRGVGHVQDETRVAAVNVILLAEQGGELVEQDLSIADRYASRP